MVGISVIEQGSFVADRYRVVERLTRFAVADSTLTGVEYEYWLALDETRGVEVWLQVAESRGTVASGAELAGVVAALRRLNHPAVPPVLDFGEIEVEITAEAELGDGTEQDETVVLAIGYVVLEPVEAESLATVLLRAALTEAEILAALIEIADVLKVLHEVELVHGHLSAYSFLLTERSVLLIDLAAALALETASGSELTAAADVYALAWLACVALAGVEAVEAEFGVGFDAGSSPESAAAPQLLTVDLVERRRAWASANLIATYGVRAELAALLIAALGEANGRPAVAALAAALRVREDVTGAAAGAAAAEAAAVLAAAEVVEAVEVVEAAQVVEAAEVIEAAEAEIVAAAAVVEAEEAEQIEAEQIEAAQLTERAGSAQAAEAFVGAGVGVAMGAEAMAGGARGGGGGAGSPTPFASVPVLPPQAPSPGRHGSPPRRPRSAIYVAIAIVVLIIVAIAWGCSSGGNSTSSKPSAPGTTAGPGQASASAGGGVSPSASAGQGAASPSAGASTGSTAPIGGVVGGTPGYTATPLATAPASPSQALQQIQQTVSQAQSAGQLPQQATGPLSQAIDTLRQEIAGNSSVQTGISQLRSALKTPGVPAGFVTQINELIPYLVTGQGS